MLDCAFIARDAAHIRRSSAGAPQGLSRQRELRKMAGMEHRKIRSADFPEFARLDSAPPCRHAVDVARIDPFRCSHLAARIGSGTQGHAGAAMNPRAPSKGRGGHDPYIGSQSGTVGATRDRQCAAATGPCIHRAGRAAEPDLMQMLIRALRRAHHPCSADWRLHRTGVRADAVWFRSSRFSRARG